MDFEQPRLVEGAPAQGRGIGTRWTLRSLPIQTLCFYDCVQTLKMQNLENTLDLFMNRKLQLTWESQNTKK